MLQRNKAVYQFGQFRLDSGERVLLRDGSQVPLTPKIFDLLLILVENGGRLVEKSLLMERLWPDTYIEDVTLVSNISDLRKALGEGENGHKFIQTVPKSGYRFVAEVMVIGDRADTVRRRWLWWVAAGLAVLSVAMVVSFRSPTPRGPARLEYTQLTNFADPVVSPALSADGRLLTFIRGDSTFVGPGEIYVQLLPNGEPVELTRDRKQKMSPVFSPDGSRIAYTTVNESADWDTWSVPALGGPPREFLINAGGLTWTHSRDGQSRVLFSEMTGEGFHMALTAATENRLDARRVYTPSWLGGMAHRSSVSPDGRWVLVVEMGRGWLPCRLVPFDGTSLGRVVGPRSAPCTDVAWSPDGGWMYFSANAGNGFHIWRQRFPNGEPEQVTAGATEEQGLAFAPDGRSFVTSIGVDQNTIWVHDSRGERQVTFQGYAYSPKFSTDGKRLYYMLRSGVSTQSWVSGELRVTDLESGEHQRLLSDFRMKDYSPSPDGKSVVFTAVDDTGRLPVWIAPLDGSSPPRRLADVESERALFGPDGDIFFIQDGILNRIRPDGSGRQELSGRQKLIRDRFVALYGLSADGKWAAVWKGTSVVIYSLEVGSAIELCSLCGTMGAENRGITPPVVSWSQTVGFCIYTSLGLHGKHTPCRFTPGRFYRRCPRAAFTRRRKPLRCPERSASHNCVRS